MFYSLEILIDEVDHQSNYQSSVSGPSASVKLIKSIIVCELYSFERCLSRFDTAERVRPIGLGAHLDVDRAVRLLADPNCGDQRISKTNPVHSRCRPAGEITAPLRWAENAGVRCACQSEQVG